MNLWSTLSERELTDAHDMQPHAHKKDTCIPVLTPTSIDIHSQVGHQGFHLPEMGEKV